MRTYALCFTILFFASMAYAQTTEIREYMDLQIHPTMHVPYAFFGKGLKYFDAKKPPKLRYKHQFKNVNYANYLENNKGARIIVTGALTTETIKSKKKARKVIMEQIDYINQFAKEHSDKFAVAKSPQALRDLVHQTDKTIIVHSIEGAKKLVNSAEDAQFWASQGVAFITLMHLVDYQNGAAAIKPGLVTALLNFRGLLRKERNRKLTAKGKQVILWLAQAGIMTDLTHASDQTRKDALDFMAEKGIPPLSTHDGFKPIQNSPRAISAEDVLRIYQLHGLYSLPISGEALKPYRIQAPYKALLDSLKKADCYCNGSIDSYKFSYLAVKQHIENNAQFIFGDTLLHFQDLPETEKVKLSIGFQTDFNGWLNHHRPRYGKKGCYAIDSSRKYSEMELRGMRHPGMMAEHWDILTQEGVDLAPIKRASERFVQMWEYMLANKLNFKD